MQVRELNGYRVVYCPSNPMSYKSGCWKGYVYEHRKVYYDFTGKEVGNREHVHHLNGNKNDNRFQNLILLSDGDHAKLHIWLNSGASGLETTRENGENCWKSSVDNLNFCVHCGLTIQNSTNKKYCSSQCSKFVTRENSKKRDLDTIVRDFKTCRSFVKLGKLYGVSDNAIRKWVKSYGVDPKTISSRSYGKPQEGSETSGVVAEVEST